MTILVTTGEDLLPRVLVNPEDLSPAWLIPLGFSALLTVIAVVLLLLLLRWNSVLDLWLTVVMVSNVLQSIVAFGSRSRFHRHLVLRGAFAVLAATLVLFVLLYETSTLYAQLLHALLGQRRERAARLMMGEAVSASIAHEVRQPLAAMTTNAAAGLRWLKRETPDLEEVRAALQRIVNDGHRDTVIENVRAAFKAGAGVRIPLDVSNLVSGFIGPCERRAPNTSSVGRCRVGRAIAAGDGGPNSASAGTAQPHHQRRRCDVGG